MFVLCACLANLGTIVDRGEGANHAILDVLDFKNKILPDLVLSQNERVERWDVRDYAEGIVKRTRPAVMASRQACLDAHDWERISPSSPLLTRRQMFLNHDG